MNSLPVRTAVKQVGLWALLVLVVAGLTALFTLLATLVTAVLTGLMMGAAQRWKRQLIPVSLVFPLVALLLGQTAKDDLGPQQRLSTAAVCLGAFWVTYVVTLLVMRLEQNAAPPAQRALAFSQARVGVEPPTAGGDGSAEIPPSAQASARAVPAGQLSLQDLQGTWWCETNDAQGNHQRRRIEIAGDKFALSIANPDSRARVVAEGRVEVDSVAPGSIHLVPVTPGHAADVTSSVPGVVVP